MTLAVALLLVVPAVLFTDVRFGRVTSRSTHDLPSILDEDVESGG